MKILVPLTLLSLTALFAGCATSAHAPLVLAPVGPEVPHASPADPTGTLMVYSSMDVHENNDPLDTYSHYSDYQIWSADGAKLLERIHNHVLPFSDDDPTPVHLAPGRYLVEAQSNSYGWVKVPVLIVKNRVTSVHLEGGTAEVDKARSSSEMVYLPDGQVVGSRAPEQALAAAAPQH